MIYENIESYTQLVWMDSDAENNFILGGYYQSTINANIEYPLFILTDDNGTIKWQRYIVRDYIPSDRVKFVKFGNEYIFTKIMNFVD